jgi:large subunit ribosomal protein L27e
LKSYQPGQVVLVLNGRMAGHKALIVKKFTKNIDKNFQSILLLGIKRYPQQITRKMNTKKVFKKSRIKMFLKFFNKNHILPSSYHIYLTDIKGLRSLLPKNLDNLNQSKQKIKKSKNEECLLFKLGNIFTDAFFSGENKWFYKKLKF